MSVDWSNGFGEISIVVKFFSPDEVSLQVIFTTVAAEVLLQLLEVIVTVHL